MDGIMSSKLFTTRQGTILLGVIAAVIAAVALIVYLNQYRKSVNSNPMVSVLVAKGKIPKYTPGAVIGSDLLFRTVDVPKSSLKTGAFVDESSLSGQVAVTDIYKGQQLTAADFGPATNSLTEQLNADQRAVAIPLGTPQQVGGKVGSGSYVDVWMSSSTSAGKSAESMLFQDAYVLSATGGDVILRVSPQQAGQVIFASEHAQLWLVLRPTIGTNLKKQPVISRAGG